jgi:hypothetical protein
MYRKTHTHTHTHTYITKGVHWIELVDNTIHGGLFEDDNQRSRVHIKCDKY